ncbi:halocyanin domain-containing protein [Natronomonas gomsonensis]|uniref:halocyanin domain-containing protein n=1 Tax=Natronomonas gomsonensis TaxID=1046043 RepID=UPI0015BACC57|nr:halocyanin domain-containing protein [Natronomonas gomsonensis]
MGRHDSTRRRVLQVTGTTVAAGLLAGCTGGGNGDSGNGNGDSGNGNGNGGNGNSDDGNGGGDSGGDTAQFDGWFDGVSNYDGVTDATGESEVTVEVGAGSDGLLFSPPAIRVDAGTTVVWEWSGNGGAHNVVDDGGDFESDLYSEAGETFEYTFDSARTSKYYCNPHKSMGMKGVVVVE